MRHYLNIIIAVFLLIGFSATTVKAQKKPNIIFILADDMGYGDVGAFFQKQRQESGDRSKPYELTPNLDIMAKRGAKFTQQYCNAPVCAPSRASLLTGVNQGNANVRDNQFDKAIENNHTLATVLKQAGYNTVAIGKWGLQGVKEEGPNWPAHPLKRGFDNYYGYMRHKDGHEHYPFAGLYDGKKQVWSDYSEVSAGLSKCYTTDLWTAAAKKYIITHQKGKDAAKPFFMYLAYDCPHAVIELPTQAYPKGGGLKGGLQWLGESGHMINTAAGTVDSYRYPEYANATYDDDNNSATPEVPWPDTYKRYATAVRRIDDAVGDIRQLLIDLKIDNNTLVVFTSDNGPSIESYLPASYVVNHPTFFGSYGPFDGIKRDCWEGGLRMPTITEWPNHIAKNKVIAMPSMLSDWMATFADVAHLQPPARTDGVSLLPALTGKGKQQNSLVYVEYYE
ncbi:MAG TPA: sulfatase-like hydrolase/transferase, partial [Mucilaginibacter sp.]|nr:sulfatase-like hydrolase/transferase [Mucilaginibacter sp.]